MSSSHFGFFGRIAEIDLTTGDVRVRPLAAETVADYLGGRGLATRLLYDAIDPQCDPLGPDNAFVIAASPLIGTNAPTAARGHMVFKSPLTGVIGTANSGGGWGHTFKAAGYDALVVKGRASSPVWVDITPQGIKIEPAHHLWGRDIHAVNDALTAGFEAGDRPRVLGIGPAGENLVRYAVVGNDKNRVYGRCGAGAVWGSKNLKAIRVRGREKAPMHDKEQFQSGYDQAFYLLRQAPVTKRLMRELGTAGLVELINVIDMLPHRNFQDCTHDEADLDRVSGETIAKTILERAAGCFLCPIGCQRHTRIDAPDGTSQKGEGPEYETVVLMGPDCDVYDLAAITTANYRCNELGLDTISFGGTVACAMELAEKGLLPGGLDGAADIRFGNAAVMEKLAIATAHRRGIGDLLAEGSWRLGETCGRPDLSMTVKKLEIPAYDPRASLTQALGYMTSPSGACHLRGGYAVSLAFFGGTKEIPRFSLLQSPIAIRNMQNHGILQDSLGICRFTGYAFGSDPWARMLSGTTGMDFSVAKLERIENRVAALERMFNVEAGATAADDALPPRFAESSIPVAGEPRAVTEEAQERMRRDYYAVRGWDFDGRPTQALRDELDIAPRAGRTA
ncbi:MAG: aldehyde ferredoxin oxidoreductase family protein [Candidatus Aminicenantes bacterium]|nr:aldehyde ferredoxin oxidoreductase family protein [Candidatus Aminicenantes bacterium]